MTVSKAYVRAWRYGGAKSRANIGHHTLLAQVTSVTKSEVLKKNGSGLLFDYFQYERVVCRETERELYTGCYNVYIRARAARADSFDRAGDTHSQTLSSGGEMPPPTLPVR